MDICIVMKVLNLEKVCFAFWCIRKIISKYRRFYVWIPGKKRKIFPVCNTYEFHNRKECIQCIEEWQKVPLIL